MLRQALQGYRQAVRRPAFRRFWLGMMISRVGGRPQPAGALLGVVAGPALAGRLPPWLRISVVIVAGAQLFGLLRFAPDLAVAAVLLGLATFAWGRTTCSRARSCSGSSPRTSAAGRSARG